MMCSANQSAVFFDKKWSVYPKKFSDIGVFISKNDQIYLSEMWDEEEEGRRHKIIIILKMEPDDKLL